jgi:hypothetical protein
MKTLTEPPITPAQMKWLSDEELEQELTIAALDSHRTARFDLLLAERERRFEQQKPKRLLRRKDGPGSRTPRSKG